MQTLKVEDFTFSAEKKGGRHVIEPPSTDLVEFTLELYADKPVGVEFIYEPMYADTDDPIGDERIIPLTKDNVIHLRLRTDRLLRVELVQPTNCHMAVKAGFRELTGETKVWEQVYIHPPSFQEKALQVMVQNAVREMVGEPEGEPTDELDMEWEEDDYEIEDTEFGEGFMEQEEFEPETVTPEDTENEPDGTEGTMQEDSPEQERGEGDRSPSEALVAESAQPTEAK